MDCLSWLVLTDFVARGLLNAVTGQVQSRDNTAWRKNPVEAMPANRAGTLSIKSQRFTIVLARIIPSNSSTIYSCSGISGQGQGWRKSDVEPDRPLARRGCRLACAELGKSLADIARHNLEFSRVDVTTASFETWEPPGVEFDMVFAASAWHWLAPSTRCGKAASLLKLGSLLALVTGGHAFPKDFDPFFTVIQSCYDAIGEGYGKWPPPAPEEIPDERQAIEGSGLFEHVLVRRYLGSDWRPPFRLCGAFLQNFAWLDRLSKSAPHNVHRHRNFMWPAT